MTDRERAICARVKTVRESIRWSQPPFAGQLGITRDQLAAIEYGRTPLRYEIAWSLRLAFGISLLWLECPDHAQPADRPELDYLPIPSATGLPRRALLSEVVRRFHTKRHELTIVGPEFEPRSQAGDELLRRGWCADSLKMRLDRWIAQAPDGYLASFRDHICKAAQSLMASLPKDPDSVVARRMEDLMWHKIRMTKVRRILVAKNFHNQVLTSTSLKSRMAPVKIRTFNDLLAALKSLASEPGRPAALARDLNVPQARVSEWLSGKKKPGGETTLRLVQWVEQQERKPKTLDSDTNTAKGKTQVSKSSYETPSQVRKKE
jgi:transcriptional regulator with XRE-family HTH domain